MLKNTFCGPTRSLSSVWWSGYYRFLSVQTAQIEHINESEDMVPGRKRHFLGKEVREERCDWRQAGKSKRISTNAVMWKHSLQLHRLTIHTSAALLKKAPQNLKGKSTADQRWIVRQLKDPFVKAAHAQNYRCRSAFKLLEIDDKHKILRPGLSVVDCGAAPGAWSQVAVKRVNATGENPEQPCGAVIGVDLLHIAPLDGALFLTNQDITNHATHMELQKHLPNGFADVILSDMAPNASGVHEMDHEKLISMCLSLLDLANKVLRPGGSLVCKCWDGGLTQTLQQGLTEVFKDVKTIKPKASRKESAELFFLARLFQKRS